MAEGEAEPEWDGVVAGRGDLDALFSATYEELRRLAASVRRGGMRTASSSTGVMLGR